MLVSNARAMDATDSRIYWGQMGSPTRVRHLARKVIWLILAVLERLTRRTYLGLDYPPTADIAPRYGYGRNVHPGLAKIIGRDEPRYAQTLQRFAAFAEDLAHIEVRGIDPSQPSWVNDYLPGLDGAAIYCFLRTREPKRYMEIGSGNSTKFAARAKRDAGCITRMTSIDPNPRAEIDTLCDEVIRHPLETVSLSTFEVLSPGDIVFFDGSHRVFMNSDAVAFFLDVLPALPAGVLIGVHDVYLPSDYPPAVARRYYSEQYLLAAHLLAGGDVEIELASHYVSGHPELSHALDSLWARPGLGSVQRHGVAFWFTKRY